MKYALSLAEDGRILSATYKLFATEDAVLVDELPAGDITEYKFIAGEYVYEPIPVIEEPAEPTQLDRIEAQVTYTAMMTDTLLEV